MIQEILAAVALVFSLVSIAASALLLIKREEHHELESRVRTLGLEVADVVDRLQVWQRRDATRQRRVDRDSADVVGGSEPVQHSLGLVPSGKDALRAAARARGLMR